LSLARHRSAATALDTLTAALLSVTVEPTAASVGQQLSGLMVNISAYLTGVPLTEPDPPIPLSRCDATPRVTRGAISRSLGA
jgi:hypothetical protein